MQYIKLKDTGTIFTDDQNGINLTGGKVARVSKFTGKIQQALYKNIITEATEKEYNDFIGTKTTEKKVEVPPKAPEVVTEKIVEATKTVVEDEEDETEDTSEEEDEAPKISRRRKK